MGDAVPVLLADEDLARELAVLGVVLQHLLEQLGGALDVPGGLLEQIEELAVSRQEDLRQTCHVAQFPPGLCCGGGAPLPQRFPDALRDLVKASR